MKTLKIAVILVVLVLGTGALAGDPVYDTDAILGIWKTEPNDDGNFSHIEIYLEDGKYNGKIVYLNSPVVVEGDEHGTVGETRKDFKNPDESLRGRPLLGMDLMRGFEHNGKNKWEDGRIYDPESGKEYNCKATMMDDDTLEVFGYVKVGFAKLGRDTGWTRVVEEGK
jgi:uncharacterized protein (DUF2147 family)